MQLETIHSLKPGVVFILALTLAACTSFTKTGEKKKESSDTYYQLGVRYMDLNKLEEAKESLEKAIDVDSGNAQAHSALGYLYEKVNHADEAEDEYETALKIKPDDAGIQNNYGRFLCEHGDKERGLALLNSAGANPMNERQWIALTNAGLCRLDANGRDSAEPYFRQALELNKAYAPALAAMQKISYQKGDLWAAKGFLERYLNVAEQTSETLFFAYYTEKSLDNRDRAKEYRTLLLEKFPISSEANKVRNAPD